jgi:regulator of protease activity HflC (stomatin/prohibitin superfamily)
LIRDITLPAFISKAIEAKKEREQAVEKQKAELERFKTEQQQVIAQAEAQRRAAEELAQQKRVLADAQAYEIEKINQAIGSNPSYIKLQSLEALKSISKDPASKVYFIDSNSSQPLPLMHLSDK